MEDMTSPTASERRRRDRLIIVLSVVLSLLLVGSCFAVPYMPYILTGGGASREGRGALRDKAAGGEESAELVGVLRGSEAYARAQNIVEANYVDEVDPGCLLRSAARGIRRLSETGADEGTLVERGITAMVDSLDDPFSSFMSADELAMLDTQLSGRLSGIGAALEKVKNEIRVTRVIEGTPAHEARLQDGDIVKEVDGRDVGSMELEEAVFLIRGPEGNKGGLGLVRPPSLGGNQFEIGRRGVGNPVIRIEMKDGGVG